MKSKSVITPPLNSDKKGSFSAFAEIIGFITDSKEIITTLFSLLGITSLLASSGEGSGIKFIFTNLTINPWFSFSLWWLAFYTFLGFARREWTNHKELERYRRSFFGFLLRDLLFGFKNIPYSVLAVSFCILFVWNLVSIFSVYPLSKERAIQLSVLVLPLLMILLASMTSPQRTSLFRNSSGSRQKNEDFERDVYSNWEKWEVCMQSKMNNLQWISVAKFEDVKTLYSVGDHQIYWLMSRYALEHPGAVHLGFVYNKSDNTILAYSKVLVDLKNLDRNKYYCG
jgi:hypothetical protein